MAKLTGRQLFFLTVHVIKKLEEIGFSVERVVGDNAKINVKLFQLLRRPNDVENFKVTNPANPCKKMFLSYDYTHIIKNVRNQLIDRKLVKDGKNLDFGLIRLLYQRTINDSFHICRFLTRKHIDPTNFEKMKVKLAIDIFKPEVPASLRSMCEMNKVGFTNVEPLCKFLELMWNWFCYHDVSNTTQHVMQRLEVK